MRFVSLGMVVMIAGLASCPQQADAQETSGGKWSAMVGAGVAVAPRYDGAKNFHLTPVPMVTLSYDNRVFLSGGGLTINLADRNSAWRYGPLLGVRRGRDESDDGQLRGLGDIDTALTGGVFVEYRWQNWNFAAQLSQAVTDTKYGATAKLGAQYRFTVLPGRLTGSVGPELVLGDRQYQQTWFGISEAQARRAGRTRYTPGAGLKEVGLSAELTWRLTEHLYLRSFASLRVLAGTGPSDSPLVRREFQPVIGSGIVYRF